MNKLSYQHIRKIEDQLNECGYKEPIFNTISYHPNKEVTEVMIWFKENLPSATFQYIIARLNFNVDDGPIMEIV
jgi:hypothetical protein